jgi:DNA-directed RNA polymerase subunit E'/Rpb7
VIPAGARVYGQLQQADRSGAVSIKFSELELLDGNREKIEAIGTSLELGPIKGSVSGKNTGKNFLVRTASGIGSVAAMLVGNNTSTAFSEDDLIRERIAQNAGNAGDTEIMNMAVTGHIVVSVPAGTPIYIVFTKREAAVATSHQTTKATP